MKRKICLVAGARPNFMKIAPLEKEISEYPDDFEKLLVHTGQHYDDEMSKSFFKDLNLPEPDIYLGVGSGSHAEQTARIMIEFEKVCSQEKPDSIVVVGDVNSTLACSIVASKMNIKIAHVEAGLRSFDRTMPEEINRIVTDSLSDFLFVSEKSGITNLYNEGVNPEKLHFVGNIMIDSLLTNLKAVEASQILKKLKLEEKKYCAMTLHRPDNVDHKKSLTEICEILAFISEKVSIVYPIHPRTYKMLKAYHLLEKFNDLSNLHILQPLGYLDFMKLMTKALFVMTDSGGIQEETTYLNIPCLTLRNNTERPITLEEGSNQLVGRDIELIKKCVTDILDGNVKDSRRPELWDGKTATRIVEVLRKKEAN